MIFRMPVILASILIGVIFNSCNNTQNESAESEIPQVTLTTSPEAVKSGVPSKLEFVFRKDNKILSLDISHERKVHLMLVSEDLSWFRHVHPEEQKDGSYAVTETFPAGGKYLLFTDFKPRGDIQVLNRQEVEVQGEKAAVGQELSEKSISKAGEYIVTLQNADDLKTNRNQVLQITIEKNGLQLLEKDIQRYLGATAHIVMISKADKDYLHIHPGSDSRFPVFAETLVKKPGIYRMWVQFQIEEKIHTADFTVNVANGAQAAEEGHQHSH